MVFGAVPGLLGRIERDHGRDAALAMRRGHDRLRRPRSARSPSCESIDCDFARGGTLSLRPIAGAADQGQARGRRRPRAIDDDLELLPAARVRERAGAAGVLGATLTPHCAAIDPGALVRGLADVVERRGVRIVGATRRRPNSPPHRITTTHGTVRADVVVRATEAFGSRAARAPSRSGADLLAHRGHRATGHRTDSPRSAWHGGRPSPTSVTCCATASAPPTVGSCSAAAARRITSVPRSPRPNDRNEAVFARLRGSLVAMFPALDGVAFTHSWGGAVAAPRDWHASVGLDRATGLAWAGGYVGDGVSTANLAGRTLADLITGRDSELVRPALGRTPVAPLGTRAAALPRDQRGPGDGPVRGRAGGSHGQALPRGGVGGALRRRVSRPPARPRGA